MGGQMSFIVGDDGIHYRFEDVNGKINLVRICAWLEVVALVRDPSSNNWCRLLRFKDRDGKRHEWVMPMALLAGGGKEVLSKLLSDGLEIEPGGKDSVC